MERNALYYGDCLDWMDKWLPEARESIDLIYLDPPFNSNTDYNILFGSEEGTSAQMRGFTDTWKWDNAAVERVARIEQAMAHPLHTTTRGFKALLGESGMLAYLTYMGERLALMRDLLKPSASIYLHCDPTASHYLKALMDHLFGAENFRNEIIWKRTSAHSDVSQGARHMGRIHDTMLAYSKTAERKWNTVHVPYDEEYIKKAYRYRDDDGRRYQTQPLHAARPGGDTRYEWRGKLPPPGRYWAYSLENMKRLEAEGRIAYSRNGTPRYKVYLDERAGRPLQDIWDDVTPVHVQPKERLGYPTQKPVALLERIITASSDPGDIVLDPFCGCGTAIVAAHNLEREWVGIDISATAIDIVEDRRLKPLGIEVDAFGMPQGLTDARKLAAERSLDFEAWAVTRIGGLAPNERKVGDHGIDGRGMLLHKPDHHDSKLVLAQVKGGAKFNLSQFRDFLHVVERDNAAAGVFITTDPVTSPAARAEASQQGDIAFGASRYPRVQLWSIADFFEGKMPSLPALADPYTGRAVQPYLQLT